jgi:hypothetical protein
MGIIIVFDGKECVLGMNEIFIKQGGKKDKFETL